MINYLRSRFDFWTLATVFIVLVCVILLLSEWLTGKRDGLIEESIEDYIYHETGVNVDLSPDTVETGYLP